MEAIGEMYEPDFVALQETFMCTDDICSDVSGYRVVLNEIEPNDCALLLHPRWHGRITRIASHRRAVLCWLRADTGTVLVISAHLRHSWGTDEAEGDVNFMEDLDEISSLIDLSPTNTIIMSADANMEFSSAMRPVSGEYWNTNNGA